MRIETMTKNTFFLLLCMLLGSTTVCIAHNISDDDNDTIMVNPVIKPISNADTANIIDLLPPAEIMTTANSLSSSSTVPNHVSPNTSKTVGQIGIQSGISQTGAKTYSVPMTVYPGINGLTPQIALSYSSQAGNGPLGVGWSISGLSSISRVAKSTYYDNTPEKIKLDTNDAFSLNGTRLIKIGSNTYQTETGNIKITAHISSNTVCYFEVFYPDGRKGIFGNTYNTTNQLTYPLTKLTDAYDNSIDYSYTFSGNYYRIDCISYNNATINFSYDTRNDNTNIFIAGKNIQENNRLKNITCKLDNTLLGTYTLAYKTGNKYTLLSEIQYSGKSGSVNPLKFYYEDTPSFSYNQSSTMLTQYFKVETIEDLKSIYGNVSCFGKSGCLITWPVSNQYLHIEKSGGIFSSSKNYIFNKYPDNQNILLFSDLTASVANQLPTLQTEKGFIDIMFADLTGKLEDCIIKINNYVNANKKDELVFNVYKGNGTTGIARAYTRTFTFNTTHKDHSDNWSIQPKRFFAGDFDGDGKSEILAVGMDKPLGHDDMPGVVYIFDLENNKIVYNSGLLKYTEKLNNDSDKNLYKFYMINNSDKLFVADIDGDGKSDLGLIDPNGMHIYSFHKINGVFTGEQAYSQSYPTRNSLENKDLMLAETNGDGLTDIIISPDRTTKNTTWTVYRSKGDGTFQTASFSGPNNFKSATYTENSTILFHDINSDGLTDVIRYNSQNFSTYLLNNNSTTSNVSSTLFPLEKSLLVPANQLAGNKYTQLFSQSINSGTLTKYSCSVHAGKDNLLAGVANSLGNVEKNEYRIVDSYSSGIYTSSYIDKFPYTVIKENVPVLYTTELYVNGIKADNKRYTYQNAILHKQGLGFKGFEKITCYDNRNQVTVTTYDPYNFGVIKEQSSPLSSQTNTYSVSVNSNKLATINLTGKQINNKLTNVMAVTQNTFDNYGYPLTEKTTYSDYAIHKEDAVIEKTYTYNHKTDTKELYKLGNAQNVITTTKKNGDTYTEKTQVTAYNNKYSPAEIKHYVDGNLTKTINYTYDSNGNITNENEKQYSSKNALSKTFQFDVYGRVTKETDMLGLSNEYSYDNYGLISSITDKYGKKTTYGYDGLGRQTSVTYPDGTSQATTYAWTTEGTNGLYAVTESSTGTPTTKIVYDALNREVRKSVTNFNGTASNIDLLYDSYGRLQRQSYPFTGSASSWDSYTYDSYDRMTKSVIKGVETSFSYSGKTTTATVDGTSVTKETDALGNLVKVTDSTGTLSYNLNADGQPSSIVSPTGVTTTFTYDEYRRQTGTNDPSLGITTKSYNADGTLKNFTDAEGHVISYGYDSFYRMASKSTDEQTTNYVYNQYNNIKETNTSNGSKTLFVYDSYGRMTSSTEYADANVWLKKDFTYSDGNVSSVRYTSQTGVLATENKTYQNGYLTETKLNNTKSIYKLNAVDAYGNATNLQTGGLIFNNGYNAYGNIASTRISTGEASVLSHRIFGYDAAKHRLISLKDYVRNITEEFEYDSLDRLTKYGANTVKYDDNGNITEKSDAGTFTYGDTKPYAVNGLNAATNIPSEQQDITYTQFYRPNTITQGCYSAEFVYNSDYDRIKMTVTDNGNACLTRYYLGGCYEMDITPSGTKEKLYFNGDYYDATSVIVKEGSASTLYNIIRDNIGSITHIVDENNNIVQELSYDAWGRLRNPATHKALKANEEPILLLGRGYTGHEHLQMFGLINMNARLYDPVLGRFLSPDPYVQSPDMSQNFNRYSYCLNNPLMHTDVTGEWIGIDDFLIGAVGFVAGYVSSGLSTGNWGWSSVKSGLMAAGAAWVGFNSSGMAAGTISSTTWNEAMNIGMNTMVNGLCPSLSIPITSSLNVSTSLLLGYGTGGLSAGIGIAANYGNDRNNIGISIGNGTFFSGWLLHAKISGFGLMYGKTRYYSGYFHGNEIDDQIVGTHGFEFGNTSFKISNDLWGDKEDRWRSSAAELSIGSFTIGTYVDTNFGAENGRADKYWSKDVTAPWPVGKNLNSDRGAWNDGRVYMAPLWIGVKRNNQIYRYGYSGKHIQNMTQNLVHKGFGHENFYLNYDYLYTGPFSYSGAINPFSLWGY